VTSGGAAMLNYVLREGKIIFVLLEKLSGKEMISTRILYPSFRLTGKYYRK
jgi:hypothetical protein